MAPPLWPLDSLAFTMAGWQPRDTMWGIEPQLNIGPTFSLDVKTLTATLRLHPTWLVCEEVALLSEVSILSSTGPTAESLFVYGIEGTCAFGDVTFTFGESLVESKNDVVTGNAAYWEMFGTASRLPFCCEAD